MRPNIRTKKDENSIMFECECHGKHFLEFNYWPEDAYDFWVEFVDYPNTLWSAIKWWWRQRKVWVSETSLSEEDIKALHTYLGNYLCQLEEFKKQKELLVKPQEEK